jgi:hypothetical protein
VEIFKTPTEYLVAENRALRRAGCKLAEAALYVAREYDGVHRLLLAASEWTKVLANEGGRGRRESKLCRRKDLEQQGAKDAKEADHDSP